MKKVVFAAIAALVMVSVSNVFAGNSTASVRTAAPVDTVAPADTTVKTPADSTKQAPASIVNSVVAE